MHTIDMKNSSLGTLKKNTEIVLISYVYLGNCQDVKVEAMKNQSFMKINAMTKMSEKSSHITPYAYLTIVLFCIAVEGRG